MLYKCVSGLFFLLLAISQYSCYTPRYVYSPSAHNVPVITKKGDSKLAALYSTNVGAQLKNTGEVNDNRSSGLDVQAAYAINDHWAVQASYNLRHERNGGNFSLFNADSSMIRYERHLTEAGVGYYRRFAGNGRATFQLFSGIGMGKFSIKDNGRNSGGIDYSRYHTMNVFKWYVQPAIVLKGSNFFTVALSSRFSFLQFYHVKTDYTTTELDNYKLAELDASPVSFWEPSFVNSFWLKKLPYLRLEYQAGLSILMSRAFVDTRSFNFSAGLVFDPVLLHKTKAAKRQTNNR